MSTELEALIEAARKWAEFAEDLPTRSEEDEQLLEAIKNYEGEGA